MKTDFDQYVQNKIKKHPFLKEELKKADMALNIAGQVYALRKKARLTQKELAELVGTRQSNIARIESADYTGYTWKTLEKITKALKARLEVRIVPLGPRGQVQI
ncbi:helix-turn-helix transcriptional regulator [Candidatus Daviesbacteria bacterium]|nr:helix-turn-helix transcriptional regulator [Candidatus Daviesbacteria bacterium]